MDFFIDRSGYTVQAGKGRHKFIVKLAGRVNYWHITGVSAIKEEPVWDEGVEMPQFDNLREDVTADVAVIGGGITGIMAAYYLSQAGLKVIVLEKNRLGRGATGLTTAFLTQHLDTDISKLISMFGLERVSGVLRTHAEAIDAIEETVSHEKIACEFMRCPNLIYANAGTGRQDLQSEREAGRKAGVAMEFGRDKELPIQHDGFLVLPDQGKFHPLKYLAALVAVLRESGVLIYENTPVQNLMTGKKVSLRTLSGLVRAEHAVVATHAPFDRKLHFKKAFYTSYVLEAVIPSGVFPEAIYEDNSNPYHYWRVDRMQGGDRIILGGADHRSDIHVNAEKNFKELEDYLRMLMPDNKYEVRRRWQGPIVEPVDGLAFLGPLQQENVFYATGYSGNGMTYGVIAAKLAADMAQGRQNEWLGWYDARRRVSLKSLVYKGLDYSGEFLGGAGKNTIKYRK